MRRQYHGARRFLVFAAERNNDRDRDCFQESKSACYEATDRGAAKDGGTLEYVFEADTAEIAADFMTTFTTHTSEAEDLHGQMRRTEFQLAMIRLQAECRHRELRTEQNSSLKDCDTEPCCSTPEQHDRSARTSQTALVIL